MMSSMASDNVDVDTLIPDERQPNICDMAEELDINWIRWSMKHHLQ